MKYFLDTEFIEGFKKPIKWLPTIGDFNKPYHSIQLISIGIVAEDGREYCAIGNEWDYNDANQWVRDNAISKLPARWEVAGYCIDESPILIDTYKSNARIASEVKDFIYGGCDLEVLVEMWGEDIPIEFYAYYADYDWVLFCSLFGTMMDLPKGFPMYCRDLKQILDEKNGSLKDISGDGLTIDCEGKPCEPSRRIKSLKSHIKYPKQESEHSALDDAKWNKALYDFLQRISDAQSKNV